MVDVALLDLSDYEVERLVAEIQAREENIEMTVAQIEEAEDTRMAIARSLERLAAPAPAAMAGSIREVLIREAESFMRQLAYAIEAIADERTVAGSKEALDG